MVTKRKSKKQKAAEQIIVGTVPTVEEVVDTLNNSDTRAAKIQMIKDKAVAKFDENIRPLVEYLAEEYDIVLWQSMDKMDIQWVQEIGGHFSIIGKTEAKNLAEDIGHFYTAKEELNSGNIPLDRFAIEVCVTNPDMQFVTFDSILSVLQDDIKSKSEKWVSLGLGEPKDFSIEYVKITDKIPF